MSIVIDNGITITGGITLTIPLDQQPIAELLLENGDELLLEDNSPILTE
jgi:hypothetical protein